MSSFKSQSLALRRQIFEQNTANHPGTVALIVEMHPHSKLALNSYFKLMVNKDYTVHVVAESLRKKLRNQSQLLMSDSAQSVFLFCKNKLLSGSQRLADLTEHRDKEDNFLYFTIAQTPTF